MIFKKHSIKSQLILSAFFIPLNFFAAYFFIQILNIPLFLDMIFVYTASCYGILCGSIVGIVYTFIFFLIYHCSSFHLLYAVCCITGTLLTRLIVTRYSDLFFFRSVLLVFVSTVIISLEGSFIYSFFLLNDPNYIDYTSIDYITYNLVSQKINIWFSSFLARLPVNVVDKMISVFSGFGIYFLIDKISKLLHAKK